MKGIIWIKVTSHGRGYIPGLEDYLKKNTKFIGDGLNKEVINHNTLNFSIINNDLYYKTTKVILSEYSHIAFIYCSELLTNDIYNKLLEIENFIKKTNIYIFNPISNAKYDYDKISFFKLLSENNIQVPNYFIINRKEDLEAIPYTFPYLLRTNIDWGGKNLFFVKDKVELVKYYNILLSEDQTVDPLYRSTNVNYFPKKEIIAVEYYDPYIETLGCNLNCRVNLIGGNILVTLCDPFAKNLWTHRGPNINTATFDHVLNFVDKGTEVAFFTKCSKYLINFVDTKRQFFRQVQSIIGLHTIAIDFIINKGNIILLECNLKLGMSPYKVPQFVKYSESTFDYYKNYQNDAIRNHKLLQYLSAYPRQNIYIDIDGTVANNIERIKKWTLTKDNKLSWPGTSLDKGYYTDVLIDAVMPYSREVISMLYEDYDIIFITARTCESLTKKWLNKYYNYTNIIFRSLDKKIGVIESDKNFYYYIDDFTKGYEFGKFTIRQDIIDILRKKKIRFSIFSNWLSSALKEIKPKYKEPYNNKILLSDVYDGYSCIHGKSDSDILVTIFIVTIFGAQLQYAIDSINKLKTNSSFIVHFIANISPTSLAYQKMNLLVRTPYFIQMDEDMILEQYDDMVNEGISGLSNEKVFNVCFRLKDDLLGITKEKYLYGIKMFNSVLMKNITYAEGISSVDRELNHRMDKIGKTYKLSEKIVGYHAKYRDTFEIMLKYAKMTNSLLLNNVQYSVIDSIRIFDVLRDIDLDYFYNIAIKKWNIKDKNYKVKYDILEKQYNSIPLKKFTDYGFTLKKTSHKKKIVNDTIYYAIFGVLYSLIIGFKYDFEKYPIKEYNLIKK